MKAVKKHSTFTTLSAAQIKLWAKRVIGELSNPSSTWQTMTLVMLAALAYAYRAKQYILKPQLYAEDGVRWLADGHNKNIFALLQPVNGFLHFPERLYGFILARFVPLELAPLLFCLTAWVLFILMVYYLLSRRTKIFTNNFERIFIVGCLALVANLDILFFNFSNSVFLMGISAAMLVGIKTAKHRTIDIAEKAFFFLSCLTLPFAWFLLPISLIESFKNKQRHSFYVYASLFGTIVQILYYVTSHVNRSPVTLLSLFSKYTLLELYNQIVIPAIRFTRLDIPVADYSAHHYQVFNVFMVMILLVIATAVVIKKSNRQVFYLLFFLIGMTFASIKSPTLSVKLPVDALKTMAVITGAGRYFVYGIVAVNIIFVKTSYRTFAPKARYGFLIAFFLFGLLTTWHYQTFFVQKDFTDYTQQYSEGVKKFNLPQTKTINIPSNPTPWIIKLTKY